MCFNPLHVGAPTDTPSLTVWALCAAVSIPSMSGHLLIPGVYADQFVEIFEVSIPSMSGHLLIHYLG